MSPHILIDKFLDAVGDSNSPDPLGIEALRQITANLLNGSISIDEFEHYCERQRKAVMRAPRRAA